MIDNGGIVTLHPVVLKLQELIGKNRWGTAFEEAIKHARASNIALIEDIENLGDFLERIDSFLSWVPSENLPGNKVIDFLSAFYFILDQSSVRVLQNGILPSPEASALTPLSAWMVEYVQAMGEFMDKPESLSPESLRSFIESPSYNMSDYVIPHGGWKTFNQFFARHFKPGLRPIAAICDPSVIVSPADSCFSGQWEIRSDSQVTAKGLRWSIGELLEGSPFRGRFINGVFMHAFLGPNDYHRQHAPVQGTVVEARVIPGQVSFDVIAEPIPDEPGAGRRALKIRRRFEVTDGTGFQFAQARGLIVIDSPIGLVAVLPIGMAQVSSVILTAEKGVALRKGEELSYFQFGGSDIVVLFEAKSNVCFSAQPGVHYKMGSCIAHAYPVE